MIEKLEKLRDEWAMQAWGVERTHGDDAPAARALRACVGDLYGVIRVIKADHPELK